MEQRYLKNNEIPTYKNLIDFLETTQINYNAFNWTDKNDGNSNIFKPKERIFNFIIYNFHLYLIDNDINYNKIKNLVQTNSNYIILDEIQFNKKFNELLKNNIHPEIIKADKEFNTINADIKAFKLKNDTNNTNDIYIKDDKDNTMKNLLLICTYFEIQYNPYITIGNVINKILEHNNIREVKSFFLYEYSARDIIYSEDLNEIELYPDNFETFDQNKYFLNLILSLEYIPIINNLIHKTEKYLDGEEINNNYFYSIDILDEHYNLWFRNDDLYFGAILNTPYYKPMINKMLKENKIKIIDKIKCDWIPNYYKPIIEKLYKMVEIYKNDNNISTTIKLIVNILIGKFQKNSPEIKNYFKNIHIEKNNDAINYHNNEHENYFNYINDDNNDKYKLFYDIESKKNNYFSVLENHRPLRGLIYGLCWLNMLKFVIDNNIDEKDIIQIKVDSITIRNKKNKPLTKEEEEEEEKIFEELNNSYLHHNNKKKNTPKHKVYNKDDEIYYNGKYNFLIEKIKKEQETDKYKMSGIKFENYKKASNSIVPSNNISFQNDIIKHTNKFIVNLAYAGCGKSYKIEQLINECIKNNKTYILLAPMHKVLKLYPKNINKNTVQHYFKNNKIPTEDIIFIDEALIINDTDFKYIINWLYTHHKDIYIFGDDKQLPPITKKYYKKLNEDEDENENENENENDNEDNEKTILNIEFLKCISTEFNYFLDTDKNFRNNFNFNVYDLFINNEYTIDEQKIIINHFINDKADETKPNFINICYRNNGKIPTRDIINNEYLKKNNQIYDKKNKKIVGINIPLISTKNYKVNENIIICAKDDLNLDVIDNKYILSYEDINDNLIKFELDIDKIFSLFNVRYCLTLYNIQGQTLTNFKFVLDDVYFLNKNNRYSITGAFYTLLSRIKETLTENKITIEDINNILTSNKKTYNKTTNNLIIQPINRVKHNNIILNCCL